MKNFTMKRVLAGALCAAGVIASALTTASACTTDLCGRKSYAGKHALYRPQ